MVHIYEHVSTNNIKPEMEDRFPTCTNTSTRAIQNQPQSLTQQKNKQQIKEKGWHELWGKIKLQSPNFAHSLKACPDGVEQVSLQDFQRQAANPDTQHTKKTLPCQS